MPKAADVKCPGCDQPMLPKGKLKKPNEYDHAQGCPLDPTNPNNYPTESGNELQIIIKYAVERANKFTNYSSIRSVTYVELADCYLLIMRLAAYVQSMEGAL